MIQSTGQVELYWPTEEKVPLREIEKHFQEWISEARRRGCPDTADVMIARRDYNRLSLDMVVVWSTKGEESPVTVVGGTPVTRMCTCQTDICRHSCPVCDPGNARIACPGKGKM